MLPDGAGNVQGSPPRVRGKAAIPIQFNVVRRITPACAGKSARHIFIIHCSAGSPPRVRGKGQLRAATAVYTGITPACAGKRFLLCVYLAYNRDHPRVCGEKCWQDEFGHRHPGSPPRVRGKAFHPRAAVGAVGITPACAGKSCLLRKMFIQHQDHPRVCGEKALSIFLVRLIQGSPPRVRGKGTASPTSNDEIGITPACAGKSGTINHVTQLIAGSPPRVRGKGHIEQHQTDVVRITPACAGKSSRQAL